MNKGAGISLVLLMAAVFVGCNNGTKPVVQAIKQTSVAVPAHQEGKRDPVTGDCTTSIFAILKSSERFQSLTAGLAERIEKKGGTSYG